MAVVSTFMCRPWSFLLPFPAPPIRTVLFGIDFASKVVCQRALLSPVGSVKRFKMQRILRSPLATRAPFGFSNPFLFNPDSFFHPLKLLQSLTSLQQQSLIPSSLLESHSHPLFLSSPSNLSIFSLSALSYLSSLLSLSHSSLLLSLTSSSQLSLLSLFISSPQHSHLHILISSPLSSLLISTLSVLSSLVSHFYLSRFSNEILSLTLLLFSPQTSSSLSFPFSFSLPSFFPLSIRLLSRLFSSTPFLLSHSSSP